jgi:hypothetical protein
VQLASHKDSGIDGEIVSGGVAFFGTVLELDDSLLILLSDGSRYEIGGDPISWKVFPKSRHYENHLHVIFEDRIDVFSFNQDYFVDQREKVFGNSYLALEFALASSSRRHFTPSFTAPLIDYRSLLIEEDPDEDEIDLFLENATAVRPKPRLTNGT